MKSALQEAFIEDHQTLTRGLSELIALVEEEGYEEASRVARELDAAVGPHIEFEEKSFYPEVLKSKGAEYVENLFDEHRSGLEAVRVLSELGPGAKPEPSERERILSDLRCALDHAVSCGTLLSHVTRLPEDEQRKFLAELEHYRALAHKWTELGGD